MQQEQHGGPGQACLAIEYVDAVGADPLMLISVEGCGTDACTDKAVPKPSGCSTSCQHRASRGVG